MAKKVTVTLIDDVDGKAVADETVEFGIDGIGYQIDLSAENAAELRDVLEVWAQHARRTGGRADRARTNAGRRSTAALRSANERARSGTRFPRGAESSPRS